MQAKANVQFVKSDEVMRCSALPLSATTPRGAVQHHGEQQTKGQRGGLGNQLLLAGLLVVVTVAGR